MSETVVLTCISHNYFSVVKPLLRNRL